MAPSLLAAAMERREADREVGLTKTRRLDGRGCSPQAIAGQRAWRRNELAENPPPPCVVCHGPRTGWRGTKCVACHNRERCERCGTVQARWRSSCKTCKQRLPHVSL